MGEDFQDGLRTERHDEATESSLAALDAEEAAGEFGVLFSHAHEHEVAGGFKSEALALIYGDLVMTAQPGIEAELMRRDGAGWVSVRTGEDPATVTRARWDVTS